METRIRKSNGYAGNPRQSYDFYGLDRQRVKELEERCKAGVYPSEMLQKACNGFEWLAPWILLSVRQKRSYERLEFDMKLGRVPAGKTDFYALRRRFYHNLDCLLRAEQENAPVKEKGKG